MTAVDLSKKLEYADRHDGGFVLAGTRYTHPDWSLPVAQLSDLEIQICPEISVAWDRDGMPDAVMDAVNMVLFRNSGTLVRHHEGPEINGSTDPRDSEFWYLYISWRESFEDELPTAVARYIVSERRWQRRLFLPCDLCTRPSIGVSRKMNICAMHVPTQKAGVVTDRMLRWGKSKNRFLGVL